MYDNSLEESEEVNDILTATMEIDSRFKNSDRDLIEVKSEVSEAWASDVQKASRWKETGALINERCP